jgi:hypothetical protein
MSTTLEDWLNWGWLVRHKTSSQEMRDLLALADRDIQNAQVVGLSADWRMSIAYNAALQSANAALAASGYRSEKSAQHYRVIQSLEYTIGADQDTVARIDAFRKRRNISSYDRPGTVSDVEANEMLELAREIRAEVEAWLRANKPHLVGQ